MLQLKEAFAYGCYMATNTFLPNVVNAVVLFYGGTLVLVSQMSAGALVAFMLYQQSLASAFQASPHHSSCMPVHPREQLLILYTESLDASGIPLASLSMFVIKPPQFARPLLCSFRA